jgi:hypothetical protein
VPAGEPGISAKYAATGLALAVLLVACAWLSSCSAAFAAGDANRGRCGEFPSTESSPGFRSFLPDCRAYELVTPPYKGGQFAHWTLSAPPPVSPDGEHLLGLDFAGFAGTENEEEVGFTTGAIYEFSRTPSGWSAEALEPPASQHARSQFLDASADLSRSLWALSIQSPGEELAYPEKGNTLNIRERVGDEVRFSEVGPTAPPGVSRSFGTRELALAGASRDLTHLAFAMTSESGRLWPGDATREGDESLYEYVGTGSREPTLVGVSNAGPLQGATYVNEGAKLISECGTILGSSGTVSAYNAISSDGETIYFSALHAEGCSGGQPAVNELYARVAGAKTVAISEPSKEDCEECVESGKANAVFQGASEDGSRVFFMTEQELLPGQKGENLYEYDFDAEAGHRIVLVSAGASSPEVQAVARISEDGSHAYYVAKGVLTTASNANGEKAEAGADNLYVYDASAQSTAFVATLLTVAEEQKIKTEVEANGRIPGIEAEIEQAKLSIEEFKAAFPTEKTEIKATTAECTKDREKGEVILAEACEENLKEKEATLARREAHLVEAEVTLASLEKELPEEISQSVTREIREETHVTVRDEKRPFDTTPNGSWLVFQSDRDLTGSEDTSTVDQLFEYDTQTGVLARASLGQCSAATRGCLPGARFGDNGNTTSEEDAASILAPEYSTNMRATAATSALSLAEDGTVVFVSRERLTPQAVQGAENVYEYREGEVYAISPGDEAAEVEPRTEVEPRGEPRLLGTDSSGRDVFFFGTGSLVPQATDTQASWYDARIGGGFPEPVSPVGCSGDACQGPLSATPFLPSAAGSATQTAGENLTPAISKTAVKAEAKTLTRAQKLAKALKACHKLRSRTSRATCEKKAKSKYGTKVRAEKTDRRGNS